MSAEYGKERKHPRYACDLGVEMRIGESKSGYWGTLADICLGGCYINTFSPLPAGTLVALIIDNNGARIHIAGRTVTFHPGLGMGVRFLGYMSHQDEADLKSLLGALSCSATAKS